MIGCSSGVKLPHTILSNDSQHFAYFSLHNILILKLQNSWLCGHGMCQFFEMDKLHVGFFVVCVPWVDCWGEFYRLYVVGFEQFFFQDVLKIFLE